MEPAPPHGPAEPVNLLVVDDRPENQLAVRAILAGPDYHLVEAGSGPAALRELLRQDFALLLIDVMMPGMSGFELARLIKGRPRAASVPIIFLTAQSGDLELVGQAYGLGAVDYLIKPLVPELVRAKVAVFAELYRQRQRIERQAALLLQAERREAELRLVELRLAGERRYRSLADAVPHIIWTARPDGVVDYLNQRWFEFTGLSAAQTRGSCLTAVHPEDGARLAAAWEESRRTGQPCQQEVRLRRADGSFHWHLARVLPEAGPGGEVASWLGTFTEIEEQKQAQAALAEFKGTLDAVLDAVLILEPAAWRLLYANQGASALWGYSRGELLRLSPWELLANYPQGRLREVLAPLLAGARDTLVLEAEAQRRGGGRVPVELSAQHIRIDGGRVVLIARDITGRRRAELERELLYQEALEAVRAREEFLSVASHELRTPLSSLQLQVELLQRSARPGRAPPSAEQVREKLEVAARQVDRLARLITELMDVSRISAGKLRLQPEEVDLAALAGEVLHRFAADAAKAGSEVALRAEGPVVGRWDKLRLEQVVTNLLANALKFGAGKPIEVLVGGPEPARLLVRDHGIGVAPEDRERIFERFERAASARSYGGLGLGLYIVRQIVEAHGGTIRVEGEPGQGATFVVELPRERPATAEAEQADPGAPAQE